MLTLCKHHISLCGFHLISISLSMHHNIHTCNIITISRNINRINIPHSNHTFREGVVGTSKDEEVEEDLVEEEVRLDATTVDN